MLSALDYIQYSITGSQYIDYITFYHNLYSEPRVWASNRAFSRHWVNEWARPDLNWRSSPCQGDVITPRPRALKFRIVASTWSILSSTNDLRDSAATILVWTKPSYSHASVWHLNPLRIPYGTVRLALEAESRFIHFTSRQGMNSIQPI